jgi:5'(3')-deoxyribonucleotidase
MGKQTLVLDVDGVMRNAIAAVLKVYNTEYCPPVPVKYGDIKQYDLSIAMPLVKSWSEFFKNHGEIIFRQAEACEPHTGELVASVREKYFLHVASNQIGMKNKIFTLEWLEEQRVSYDHISFPGFGKSIMRGDKIIEDCIDNLAGFAHPTCYTQPWNTEWKGDRISSLAEFLERHNG